MTPPALRAFHGSYGEPGITKISLTEVSTLPGDSHDVAVIALWLGHADIRSTDAYLHADMTIKERALARMTPVASKPGRYRPPDSLLAFLESL